MEELIPKNFAELDKTSNNLIEKVSSAIGWIVTHDTPKRVAIKTYIEDIEKSDLPPLQKAVAISRAKKDIKEYANQCKVLNGALTYLQDNADPQKVEDDWISQFFNKTKLISEKEFQIIWSKLLADECNNPKSVPKSLLFTLERMDKEDAEKFMQLSAITIRAFDEYAPLITDHHSTLDQVGLSFDDLIRLESMGLIRFSTGLLSGGYSLTQNREGNSPTKVCYFNHEFLLPEAMNQFPIGDVLYTRDGTALYNAITAFEIPDFWSNTVIPWIDRCVKEYQTSLNSDGMSYGKSDITSHIIDR